MRSSSSTPSAPLPRHRRRSRAAVAATAALFAACAGQGPFLVPAAAAADRAGLLRGPRHSSSSSRRAIATTTRMMPQHGNQCPPSRERRNVTETMRYHESFSPPSEALRNDAGTVVDARRAREDPADGATQGERVLVERSKGRGRGNNDDGGRGGGVGSNKGAAGVRLSDTERKNLQRPRKRQKKQGLNTQQAQKIQQRGRGGNDRSRSRKKNIKEENDKRKDENKKLKLKLKLKQQQRAKSEKSKKGKDKSEKDKDKKEKDKGKKEKDKDKKEKDKGKKEKDKDKKEKDEGKKDKPNKNNDDKNPDKKDNGKPNKKDDDQEDKDKKDKEKPNKADGKDQKPDKDKDKPSKNDNDGKVPNKGRFDPDLLKDIGITKKQASILERKFDVTLDDMALMTAKEREKWIKMTDGKFNLSGYTSPAQEDDNKPKPLNSNNSGGGGSFSSNLKPQPTPRPTKRPKNQNKPDNDNDATVPSGNSPSSPVFFPANSIVASKPSPTPRPTKRPKNQNKPDDNGNSDDASLLSANAGGDSEWHFMDSVPDASTRLESFEGLSELDWTMHPTNRWGPSDVRAYEGRQSMKSGIDTSFFDAHPTRLGEPVYSNLTLTTDDSFEGGVLTFAIWSQRAILPSEAFFVSVDETVELLPVETASNSAKAKAGADGWTEYGVPVGRGRHKVKWSHVYNPFGMESLPPHDDSKEGGLWLDDLRHVPFTAEDADNVVDLSHLEMSNEADGVDFNVWKGDGKAVVASTSDFKTERDGSADIRFVINSLKGGTLRYKIKTDTTAPVDDFAIMINGVLKEALFGKMAAFEHRTLEVPPGKQEVTMSHRKNPGKLGKGLLKSLGVVSTDGKTLLEDVRFEEHK